MPKQPLIFHIGLHKTGTSFIQKTLVTNIDKLTDINITPARGFHPVDGNHNTLNRPLISGYWTTFMDTMTGLDGTVLLTAEGMTNRLRIMRDQELATLANHMTDAFDVRLVVTLRRQDYLKESVFSEVATHHYQGTIEAENDYLYDFDAFLTRLETAFGRRSIFPGLYRDDRREDVMANFLELAQIPLNVADLAPVPPTRVSLHRRKVAFLARLNKSKLPIYRKLRNFVVKSDAIADDGRKYLLPPDARAALVREHASGNAALCARYGTDWGDYLTTPTPDPDWTPAEPVTAGEIAQLMQEAEATKMGPLLKDALASAL